MEENNKERQKININIIAVCLAFIMGITFGKVDFDALLKMYVESKETSAVSRESTTEEKKTSTDKAKKKRAEATAQKQTETSKEETSEQATELSATQAQAQNDAVSEDETTLIQTTASYINRAEECTALQTETSEASIAENTEETVSEKAEKEGVIYRTPTGKKFHVKPGCAGEGRIETTLEEAIGLGLTPCGVCAKSYN